MKRQWKSVFLVIFFLLICSFIPVTAQNQEFRMSDSPGVYSADIVLSLFGQNGDIFYRFAGNTQPAPVPYQFPLKLTALKGEERTYAIEFFIPGSEGLVSAGKGTWIIDKRSPLKPESDLPSGQYSEVQYINFSSDEDALFYSLDGDISTSPVQWKGNPVALEPRTKPYQLLAYRKDSAGNVSPMGSWEYSVSTGAQVRSGSFQIESPVAGDFLNPQFLYISSRNNDRIFYTVNGQNPLGPGGQEYTGGVEISARGKVVLKVASKSADGRESAVETVGFSVDEKDSIPSVLSSGVYDSRLSFGFSGRDIRYTFEERMPGSNDLSGEVGITLYPAPRSFTSYTLRFKEMSNGVPGAGQFRYFYALDTRVPGEPVISVEGSAPYRKSPRVSIFSPEYARVYYTQDGSEPDENSARYNGPFVPDISQGTGIRAVRAVAYGVNGKKGEIAVKIIPYDFEKPDPPGIVDNVKGVIELSLPEETEAVFEIGFSPETSAVPTRLSPVWLGEPVELPWGMSGTGSLRFASRDKAGNVSEWVEAAFAIDNTPPGEPEITFSGNTAEISGEGRIYYYLAPVTDQKPVNGEFKIYTAPVPLPTKDGSVIRYRIVAMTEDSSGNRSRLISAEHVLDERFPVLPVISGIEDRRVYNSAVLTPRYTVRDDDFRIHYTLGIDDQEVEDPTLDSPLLNNCVIETPRDREIYYHLKLLPVFPERKKIGQVQSLRFVVDRKVPVLPDVSGMPESGVSSGRIEISLNGIGDEEEAYILVRTGDEAQLTPADPVMEGDLYTSPVRFLPGEGEDVQYNIHITVQDKAGNRQDYPEVIRFRIDRSAPALPFVEGVPVTGVSSGNIDVVFRTAGDSEAEYRLISEKELPGKALIPFVPYTRPVSISGNPGTSRVYQLEYRSVDDAGNYSIETGITNITIDNRTIPQPETPVITYQDSEGAALIAWPFDSRGEIYYRVGSRGDFVQYTSPMSISSADGTPGLIQYYLEQKSGIRSALHSIDVTAVPKTAGRLLVTGAVSGGVYGGEVTLQPPVEAGSGTIRYEVSTGSVIPFLNSHSPAFVGPLQFNVPIGSTRTFNLVFGLFADRNSQIAEKNENLSFTIDKSPPAPPVLTEIVNPDVDSRYKLIELEGRGEKIIYTLAGKNKQKIEGPFDYEGIISLDTRGKAGETVEIAAWTVDGVGNSSREEKWNVLLDQDIVYVASNGNDLFEGTRLRPFRSLEKAVAAALVQRKETIYISEGSFPLRKPVEIEKKISLYGGLNSETWEPRGVSLLETGQYFPGNQPLLSLKGEVVLKNFRFTSGNLQATVPVLCENASVSMYNVDNLDGSGFRFMVKQDRGSLNLFDSVLHTGGREGFFQVTRGSLTIQNSVLSGTGSGVYSSITLDGGSLYLENTKIEPAAAEHTSAVSSRNTYISIRDSEISSGSGERRSAAVKSSGGEIRLSNSTLRTDGSSQASVALDATEGTIILEKCTVQLGGISGVTGFLLKNTALSVTSSNIQTPGVPGFLFLIQQEGGSVEMSNTTANLRSRGEPVVADVRGGRLTLLHNTLLVGSERRRPAGILCSTGTQLFITNTILSNTGIKDGTALNGDSSTSWSIRNSNFGNWSLVADYSGEKCAAAEDLDILDADPFGGWLNANLNEPPEATFAERPFALKETSACVDSGESTGPEALDMDGQKRPNPAHGIRPFPDIGADEFYVGR